MKFLVMFVVLAVSIAAVCTDDKDAPDTPDCPAGSYWNTFAETCIVPGEPGVDITPLSTPAIPDTTVNPVPRSTEDEEIDAKVQELFDDMDAAVAISDLYWELHWSDFFTGSYESPYIYGYYEGNDNPSCGFQIIPGAGNAYYCPAEHYIAWDLYLFTDYYLDEDIGDAIVYYVIAHEWGHAIQAQLELGLVSVSSELQADCLAGAVLSGAEEDGYLIMEPGDRGEIFTSLVVFADEVEWGNIEDHGSADQRIEWYQLGEYAGVLACFD